MVMADTSKGGRGGRTERAKTSKSVRLDDRRGFDHKFNKTGFKCDGERDLYYFIVKCYEQLLRGKDASSVLKKRNFVKFSSLLQSHRLKPLPEGFRSLVDLEKRAILNKLVEEQLDASVGIVQQCQVNGLGKMEVDDGSSADLGPEYSINEASSLDGDSLQSVARNIQSDPPGRPPTGLEKKLHEFASELKRKASNHSEILLEFERWEQLGMQLMKKLKDRDICDSLGLDSSNTLIRNRQEEILAELEEVIMVKDPPNHHGKPLGEGVGLQASYSQASNFGEDVEHGAEIFVSTQMHVKQDPAIDPFPTAPSFIAHPDRNISEALNVTPTYTGQMKANLGEIHPRVAGDLQYQFGKPMMEAFGHPLSHPQTNDLWANRQIYGGEYLTTIPYSGGSSGSQMVFPVSDLIPTESFTLEQTMSEFWTEKLLNEQAPWEGSSSALWPHHWQSPVRNEIS